MAPPPIFAAPCLLAHAWARLVRCCLRVRVRAVLGFGLAWRRAQGVGFHQISHPLPGEYAYPLRLSLHRALDRSYMTGNDGRESDGERGELLR